MTYKPIIQDKAMNLFEAQNALKFDGRSQYLNFGNPKEFSFSNQLTLEAWIRPDMQKNEIGILFSKEIDGLNLQIKNNKLVLDHAAKMHSSADIIPGEWHHLAVSYNATLVKDNLKIFFNGILDSSFTRNDLTLGNKNDLLIGKDSLGNDHLFKGDLAYFVIWKSERHPWQILQDKNMQIVKDEPDLVLLVSMEKINQNTIHDSSGYNLNGQLLQITKNKATPVKRNEFDIKSHQPELSSLFFKSSTAHPTKSSKADVIEEKEFPVPPLTKRAGEITKLINRINTHNARAISRKRQESYTLVQQKRDEYNQKSHQAHQKASEIMRLANIDSIFFSTKGSPRIAIPAMSQYDPLKDKNLIAHYPLQKDAQDKSGNGHHGIASNQVKFLTDREGGCADLASEGANIQLPSFKESYNHFTISCWLKASLGSEDNNVISDSHGGAFINGRNVINGISIRQYGKPETGNVQLILMVRIFSLFDGVAVLWQVCASYKIQKDLNGWHHVAITIKPLEKKGICTVFLDGVEIEESSMPLRFDMIYTYTLYLPGAFSIGGGYERSFNQLIHRTAFNAHNEMSTLTERYQPFNGSVKEVFLFDRNLADNEVKTLYKLRSGRIEGSYIIHDLIIDHLFINDFAADLGSQRILMAAVSASNGIYSLDMNTRECKQEIITSKSPSAIDFDDDNRCVYWIEATSQIWRFNYNNDKKELVLDLDKNSLDFPNQLKVDAKSSSLFWSSSSGIWCSNPDGKNIGCLVYKIEAPSPIGLTIDKKNQRLFWIDNELKKIRSSDYFGKNIVDLYAVGNPLGGFEFVPDSPQSSNQQESYLYWNEKTVESASEESSPAAIKLFYAKADGSSQEIGISPFSADARFIINTKSQESLLQHAKAYEDLKNENLAASIKIDKAHLKAHNDVQSKNEELVKTHDQANENIVKKNEEHQQTKIANQNALNQAKTSRQQKIQDAKTAATQNIQTTKIKVEQINSDAQTQANNIKGKARENYNNAKKEKGKY